MVLAVDWAPQIERVASLWQYLQAVLAYAVGPICALFLVGLFWRGANASGALACIVVGILGAIGMGYGVISTSVLVATGMPPAVASAAVHVTKMPTDRKSVV